MIKYTAYKMFLQTLKNRENIFISGNSKKSMEIIECLRCYPLDNVFYNWQDKNGRNIVLHYDATCELERCFLRDNTLYILFGKSVANEDIAYMLLSGYFTARSKVNGSYRDFLCLR